MQQNQRTAHPESSSEDRNAIRFDPLEIRPGPPEDVALSDLNAAELMALGRASFAEGNFERAARAFGRVADIWPDSPEAISAAYRAGLSLERLSSFVEAGNRFAAAADAHHGQGDALEAAFHLAAVLYHLEDYERAVKILQIISNRSDLEHDQMLQAYVQLAVCQVEMGAIDEAESGLQRAVAFWKIHRNEEPFDAYFPSQAQFFLGEISRLRFESVQLDASQDEASLTKILEEKCRLLLEAQGRYLTAIRMNQSHWATSAGYRIGALYERLYDEMMSAEIPAGMNDEEAEIYRDELKNRVRILAAKALPIYEQTLAAAERTGTETPFVERAREGLKRLRRILAQEEFIPADVPENDEQLQKSGGMKPVGGSESGAVSSSSDPISEDSKPKFSEELITDFGEPRRGVNISEQSGLTEYQQSSKSADLSEDPRTQADSPEPVQNEAVPSDPEKASDDEH